MTTGSTWLRGVRIAAAALLVLTVAVTGCGRPPDEAWLRCIALKQSAATISVLEGDLNDGTSSTVDIELENSSLVVGTKAGTGILVSRTRIDYRMTGFSPPAADLPVNLYLSPPADGKTTTGTLTAFPLASRSLKQWLVDAGVSDPVVQLTARVTFYGLTDGGSQIETEASLGIALTNATSPGTLPAVYVLKGTDADKSPAKNGEFLVIRNGTFTSSLTVNFTDGGGTAGPDDYHALSGAVSIPAGAGSAKINVIPKPGGATSTVTVKITLANNSSYTVIAPNSASLNIDP